MCRKCSAAILDGLSYNEKTRRGGPDGTVAASIQLPGAAYGELRDAVDLLQESQRALQSSAARTLQRALQGKMHVAVAAAGGNVAALEKLKEDRRLADVRQLESTQADLRTSLNDSRRRAARLEKRLQQADGGAMLVANAFKSTLATELGDVELERNEAIVVLEDRLGVVRKRMIHLSLKLAAAQAKARVCMQRVAEAETQLVAAQSKAQMHEIRAEDYETRAASMASRIARMARMARGASVTLTWSITSVV